MTYGHSHVLVDFPAPSNARSLAEERALNRRPYWIEVDPTNVYGWRLDREANYGSLTQVRIGEKAVVADGEFGEKVYDQVRVIESGRYRVFRQEEQKLEMQGPFPYPASFNQSDATSEYELVESGPYSLDQIPLVTIYANKTDTMTSKPPLLDIAHLNLAHFQSKQTIHSLHIASQPMLVLEAGMIKRKTWLLALITRWRPSRVTRSLRGACIKRVEAQTSKSKSFSNRWRR